MVESGMGTLGMPLSERGVGPRRGRDGSDLTAYDAAHDDRV